MSRYRQDIKYWEVWNEPNIGFFSGTIGQYVDLLKAAAVVARKADPACHIVFGGTAGVDHRFIERCYELGAEPYFDVMAVHPYQWGPIFNDTWNEMKVRTLRALMDRFDSVPKPIWFTELGWSTGQGLNNDDQARLLVQGFVSSLALRDAGVAKVFWYTVKDWGGPGYGIFAEDGSRKPAFAAYQVMTRELEELVHSARLQTGDVRAHLFVDPRGLRPPVLVYWSPTLESLSLRLPALGPMAQVDQLGAEEHPSGRQREELLAAPEPRYLRLQAGAEQQLWAAGLLAASSRPPGYRQAPHTPPPPLCWASLQAQAGTERLWLIPGEKAQVRVNLWNLDDRPRAARLALTLLGVSQVASEILPAWAMHPVTVTLPVAANAPLGLTPLEVALELPGIRGAAGRVVYSTPVRLAAGPTVEFLANSYLERSVYLQPGARSGESESCRFGSEWTYKFEAPFACNAQLGAYLGAHMAGPFRVDWSLDGQNWRTVLEGHGDRTRREARLGGVQPGPVHVRVSGTDAQLEELVLTWPRPR